MPAIGVSVKLPLSIGDFGYALNENYEESIKQNLKTLLLTIPGERVMDLDFGVGLVRYLFEMDSTALQLDILAEIRRQILMYMPFLELIDVVFSSSGDNVVEVGENSFFVKVIYRIASLKIQDELDISLKSN